jgi:glycine cleavage system H lipoate-binding protein
MDFLATKGIEYLLVLLYLALFVPFWWMLTRGPSLAPVAARLRSAAHSWFAVPEGFYFHRGHTWAAPEGGGLLRVGMDDFSLRLLGLPGKIDLPAPGHRLSAGEEGWAVQVYGKSVPILAPVSGEVVEVNEAARHDPGLLAEDPYERGWLLRVAAPADRPVLANLMPAALARLWNDAAAKELTASMPGPDLGVVLQDGGVPVHGLARAVAGDGWYELASRLLLTDGIEGNGKGT